MLELGGLTLDRGHDFRPAMAEGAGPPRRDRIEPSAARGVDEVDAVAPDDFRQRPGSERGLLCVRVPDVMALHAGHDGVFFQCFEKRGRGKAEDGNLKDET